MKLPILGGEAGRMVAEVSKEKSTEETREDVGADSVRDPPPEI